MADTHKPQSLTPNKGSLFEDEGFNAWIAFEMICLIAASVFFFVI